MSLTDDWNTGKLDSGWYFVKIDNQVYPDYYNNYFVQSGDVDGLQVLAPCDYDHISELEKKAKKYDRIKVNGNYPDKISRLKSRIKHLLDLQANQDKEVEKLIEALKSVKQQTINLGDYEELGAIATISDICNKALNGESEEK